MEWKTVSVEAGAGFSKLAERTLLKTLWRGRLGRIAPVSTVGCKKMG
jgi:hypothetical protein